MVIRKKLFIRSVIVGSFVLIALVLTVSVALAHTLLSSDPSQVGALACEHIGQEDNTCSNDIFLCHFGDGCHKVFMETHPGVECGNGNNSSWVVLSRSAECGAPDIPPAIFPADVCEPVNGFSGDGWQTWDTDADGAALYYAASADGPWMTLTINGPQWVLSEANLNAMAANAGVATYGELWFKANENGYPANVGDAISNRAARMDALCGG